MKNITFKWSGTMVTGTIESITDICGLKQVKVKPTNSPLMEYNLLISSLCVGQHGTINILSLS